MFFDVVSESSTSRHSKPRARRCALLLAAIVLMAATRAHAGWPSNGLVVGDSAVTRFQPTVALASDGAHGTLSFANPWHQVTRVDPDGAPLWEVAPYVTSFPRGTALVPDGAGGVWVVHSAATDVLAGHWDAAGIPFGGNITVAHDANGTRFLATAFGDGAGGFFALWTDVPTAGEDDLRGAHVDATGTVTTPVAGTLLVGGAGAQVFAGAVADGQGGFVLMYPFGAGENLQRFGPALTPVWAASAARIQPPGAYGDFSLVASGDGGVFVTWIDGPSTAGAVRLLRLDAGGVVYAGWPVDGVAVASPLIQPSAAQVSLDRTGGVLVAWIDQHIAPGGLEPDLRVSRRLGDGSLASGWPALGALAGSTGLPALDARSALVADGAGGCFIAWRGAGIAGLGVSVQHLSASGTPAAGWSATATLLGGAGFPSFTSPVLVSDDAGGAYAAWDEYRYPYLAHEGLNVMRLTRLLPGGVAGIDPPLPQRTALSLAVANPALGRFTISPMLPDERAARLEMFDLAGRVEFRRDLQGAGPHVVTIGAGMATPGVHWLRLSHPLGVRLARVVVLR